MAALADWIEVNTPQVMANRDERGHECRVALAPPGLRDRGLRVGRVGEAATRHNHRYLLKST